jgi:hypothetical protein
MRTDQLTTPEGRCMLGVAIGVQVDDEEPTMDGRV